MTGMLVFAGALLVGNGLVVLFARLTIGRFVELCFPTPQVGPKPRPRMNLWVWILIISSGLSALSALTDKACEKMIEAAQIPDNDWQCIYTSGMFGVSLLFTIAFLVAMLDILATDVRVKKPEVKKD